MNDKESKRPGPSVGGREVAILGGGCFWCLEAVFVQLRGVEGVESGYSGGAAENPTYEEVCGGSTGHAEVVRISFDPKLVSFKEILAVFFAIHDPTTLNRQGADVGSQYRSAIFYESDRQKAVAEEVVRDLEEKKVWDRPIVTDILPLDRYYPAEDYHQNFFENHPGQGYCRAVIAPKVAEFRKAFMDRLRR